MQVILTGTQTLPVHAPTLAGSLQTAFFELGPFARRAGPRGIECRDKGGYTLPEHFTPLHSSFW